MVNKKEGIILPSDMRLQLLMEGQEVNEDHLAIHLAQTKFMQQTAQHFSRRYYPSVALTFL